MEKKINNLDLLNDEIRSQIENLKEIEQGTEGHEKAIDCLAKLYKLKLEEELKLVEMGAKIQQYNKENKQSKIKLGIEIAGIVLPLAFYAVWMNKGFKFEETGTYTSTTFRGLFQKFKTTK